MRGRENLSSESPRGCRLISNRGIATASLQYDPYALMPRTVAEYHFHVSLRNAKMFGQHGANLVVSLTFLWSRFHFDLETAIRHQPANFPGVGARDCFYFEHQAAVAQQLTA
jgi:hypothetical protein